MLNTEQIKKEFENAYTLTERQTLYRKVEKLLSQQLSKQMEEIIE